MIRGLISAARGMLQQTYKQDVIANNLANVSTAGYKRRTIAFSSFASALAQESSRDIPKPPMLEAAVGDPRVTTKQDESEGAVQTTGDKADLAIDGPGFFVVQSAGGDELTRNGDFTLNGQGELIAASGAKVMGKAGPIKVDSASKWQIDSSGRVISGGAVVDRLKIVQRDQNGGTTDVPDGQVRVVQGAVEVSNVSPMREMVNMIANMRAYEANQKSIQAIDHTLDKVINEAGRI